MVLMSVEVLVEPDDRGRVSLSKLPGVNAQRYVGRRMADGSIVLRPALVMSYQALQSLLKVQSRGPAEERLGSSLREVLDRYGREAPSEAQVEAVRAEIAHRRSAGARFLSDLTSDEMTALRSGRDGGLAPG